MAAAKVFCILELALPDLESGLTILLLFKQDLVPDFGLVSASKICCDFVLALFERGRKILLLFKLELVRGFFLVSASKFCGILELVFDFELGAKRLEEIEFTCLPEFSKGIDLKRKSVPCISFLKIVL